MLALVEYAASKNVIYKCFLTSAQLTIINPFSPSAGTIKLISLSIGALTVKLLSLPINIRLGWRGLSVQNTAPQYGKELNYSCRKF
jgi:hypothetical protein